MERKNILILATFARSFDKYIPEGNIHLISSIIYLQMENYKLDLEALKSYTNNNKTQRFLFRIFLYPGDLDFTYNSQEHGEYLTEYCINLPYLFLSNREKGWISLIEEIVGDRLTDKKDFDNILSDSLFIFHDISWKIVKSLFKLNNIIVSGGSITKRNILTTVEYNLSFYLIVLGLNTKAIYDSFLIQENLLNINFKSKISISDIDKIDNIFERIQYYNKYIYKKITVILLKSELESRLSNINNDIESLNLRIKTDEGQIKSLEEKKGSKSQSRKSLIRDTNNIKGLKERVIKLKEQKEKNINEIPLIKAKINKITDNKVSIEELESEYNSYLNSSNINTKRTKVINKKSSNKQ
uniref:Uncharacterized protein n=1 Tax=Amanita inopinata TaxID=933333 RepID=A0A5Q0N2A6_9AGAR|nr:hypothetical protein [Amanita inopinata]QFZ98603.1 hypothetical protein [Amanita inopinata]